VGTFTNYGGELIKNFTQDNLSPGTPGYRFNSSLVIDPTNPDQFILGFRNGWKGSNIFLIRLDSQLEPIGSAWQLDLHHNLEASYGREDCRLFMYNGRLHVAYAGVVSGTTQLHTSVLYARLTKDCSKVEDKWYPYYHDRNAWEKNWSFFNYRTGSHYQDTKLGTEVYREELYAIYSVHPHRILKINHHYSEMSEQSPNHTPLDQCMIHTKCDCSQRRGGASPILVGDEYWHFVHDRVTNANKVKYYRTHLYTFDSKPPFSPRRYLPNPLLLANVDSRPVAQWAAVVFTCGAVLKNDSWYLSSGVHDRYTSIHKFSHNTLESELIRI
jgi:predicted GH43/DUF377 family glycosyl hydrolase